MVELWFALLCFMLIVFVVLDGWDIGAGALHLIVARTDAERREVIAAIGPLWSWHEVWLVAAGGTFVLAFPTIMAAAFSGFYLALWMVLWSFILRGISIEVGGHIHDRMWQAGWDVVFAVSNVLLAVLFGAALGNVLRGVPIDATGKFSMALFTDFGVHGQVGILDWYTLSVAVFATLLLAAHGATYLRFKTQGPVHARSTRWARGLWALTAALFVVITVQTEFVNPDLFRAMAARPLAWTALALIAASFWALWTGLARSERAPRVRGILRRHRRAAVGGSHQHVPGDLALDAGRRALHDRVQRRDVGTRASGGVDLVADRVRPCGGVLRRHHAQLPRQGSTS